MIHVIHQRTKYRKDRTPGVITIGGQQVCVTVEDELRELPGVPVKQWKVDKKTAIPAMHYEAFLVEESKFGKDTIGLRPADPQADCGFTDLRVHGGNDEDASEGCPIVGTEHDKNDKIPGGKSKPGLKALKEIVVPALKRGERVIWDVRNPEGYTGPVVSGT